MTDFDYLRPGPEVYSVKHDRKFPQYLAYYVKHGEGNKHVRKIFYHQPYDEYELSKINEFEEYIKQHNLHLPEDWTQELTLKYCYSGGFDMAKCFQRLQKHLEWRRDPAFQIMTPHSEEYLVILALIPAKRLLISVRKRSPVPTRPLHPTPPGIQAQSSASSYP